MHIGYRVATGLPHLSRQTGGSDVPAPGVAPAHAGAVSTRHAAAIGATCNSSRDGRKAGRAWVQRREAAAGHSSPLDELAPAFSLLPSESQAPSDSLRAAGPLTVYSLRFETSSTPGSSLSTPASVNVLLVGQDGRSVMQRISPVNDPSDALEHMHSICEVDVDINLPVIVKTVQQVVDASVGANCSILPPRAPSTSAPTSSGQPPASPASQRPTPAPAAPQAKLRFQQGQVDEVSFLAPELGPLAKVLLGVESGTWVLEEVDVSSSRTNHSDRFICRARLGSDPGRGARWLLHAPPDAYVYGSGEETAVLTKEHAEITLRAMNLALPDAQSRLLVTTVFLAAGGSVIAGLAAGAEAALPFALGGVAGLLTDRFDPEGLGKALRRIWYDGDDAAGTAAGAHRGPGPDARSTTPGLAPKAAPYQLGDQGRGKYTQVPSSPAMRSLKLPPPPPLPSMPRGQDRAGIVPPGFGADTAHRPRQLWQQQQQQQQQQPQRQQQQQQQQQQGSWPTSGRGQQRASAHPSTRRPPLGGSRPLTAARMSGAHAQAWGLGAQGQEQASSSGSSVIVISCLTACAAMLATAATLSDNSAGELQQLIVAPPLEALTQQPPVDPVPWNAEGMVSELQALAEHSLTPVWRVLAEGLSLASGEQAVFQLLLVALGFMTHQLARAEVLMSAEVDQEQATLLSGPLEGRQYREF